MTPKHYIANIVLGANGEYTSSRDMLRTLLELEHEMGFDLGNCMVLLYNPDIDRYIGNLKFHSDDARALIAGRLDMDEYLNRHFTNV